MADPSLDLRLTGSLWRQIRTHVFDLARGEQAGALLVRGHPAAAPVLLVGEQFLPIPEDHVLDRRHGLRWDGRFNLRLAEAAQAAGCGILLVHAHPDSEHLAFSRPDLENGQLLVDFLARRLPGRIHGLLLLSPNGQVRSLLAGGPTRELHEIRVGADPLIIQPPRRAPSAPGPGGADEDEQDRQLLAFGAAGMAAIGTLTVGVVGISGGGSHVCQQLIHAGVGRLIPVDPQLVDQTNLRRLVGAVASDINVTQKVAIPARMASSVRPSVQIRPIREAFPSPASLTALREVDVIVGCVDGWDGRDDLNRFALAHRIPYVDIGAVITPPTGRLPLRVSGQIVVVVPGDGPCLRCLRLITDERVTKSRRQRQGYLDGIGEPQVVSINGTLASEAVTAVLALAAGTGGALSLPPVQLPTGSAYGGDHRPTLTLPGMHRGQARHLLPTDVGMDKRCLANDQHPDQSAWGADATASLVLLALTRRCGASRMGISAASWTVRLARIWSVPCPRAPTGFLSSCVRAAQRVARLPRAGQRAVRCRCPDPEAVGFW
jgi:molybdopterin/thiamine biosynthesis adenylyltransferase